MIVTPPFFLVEEQQQSGVEALTYYFFFFAFTEIENKEDENRIYPPSHIPETSAVLSPQLVGSDFSLV